MKKSQSIFLLSGLVPLVAAPITIVASCSNDTAATTTFSLKGTDITLNNLSDQEKALNQYTGSSKEPLVNLILAKKAEIFNNPPADLKNTQIEIPGTVTADEKVGSLTFEFKVKSPAENTADLIPLTKVVLKGFATTQVTDTPEQTLVNNAVAEIEKAHQDNTFKLKTNKQTIAKSDIDALVADPTNFLTEYTDGLPAVNSPLSATVKQGNLSVADKPAGSRQQQTTKQQIITFKVTVSHSTAQVEKDTKDLTFEFTLQDAAGPNKVATAAKTGVTATSIGLQADKVSVAQPKLNQAWVVANITKLLDGDQEVTADGDILALTVTPNAQDSTKLTLSFKLAAQKWYQGDGTLGNAESSVFTFEITGFTKATQVAVKKQEFTTNELGQDFETKNFAELNQIMNSAAWLFSNREKYLDGDLVPETNDKNFVQRGAGFRINFVQKTGDPTKADMTFSIATGRSYDDQGQVTTTPTQITFTVTNIRQ